MRKINDGLTAKQRYFIRTYENAPIIECACKCGQTLKSKDHYGRDQKFVNGHNGRQFWGKESESWGRNKRWKKKHPETVAKGKKNYHRARKIKALKYLGDA